MSAEYLDFLKKKAFAAKSCGFVKQKSEMNPYLFEWQKDIVFWALRKGRAALFENCGLGKTIQQLEFAQSASDKCGKPSLILSPLAVAEQTKQEGDKFGYAVTVCKTQTDVSDGINITNYERLENFDASVFGCVVLDESSILKDATSKTRTQIIEKFRETPYKLSCSATPAPNDFMEFGNQAEFLGVMRRTEMLATFFTHDGGETSKWRLKGHAESRFWEWVATWAVVLTKPSDLGYEDEGYNLPPLNLYEHIVSSDTDFDMQSLIPKAHEAKTLSERREARRKSLFRRCQKAAELMDDNQWLIWCDLNSEADMLRSVIPSSVEVRGSDNMEEKAQRLREFSEGTVQRLITKPSIAGFGLNWQKCHNMVFVGLSDSYEKLYQAVRRCWRFGQEHPVNVHIITSAEEGAVKQNIERKERQTEQMIRQMVLHTRDILQKEIRGTMRITVPYAPKTEMRLPEWLRSAS